MARTLLDVDETADVLAIRGRTQQIRRQAVYALARSGVIPAVRIGRRVRFDPEALERFIRAGGRECKTEESRPSA